jgi:hypothetical protein
MPLSRRRFLYAAGALALVGCGEDTTIARFETSGDLAKPGGRGLAQPITISYRLRRPADVSAVVRGPGGEWPLRTAAPRGTGEEYQLVFDGTVPSGEADRTVLRDGQYELRLVASEADGRRDERSAPVTVAGADPGPLEVDGPRLTLATITPDGDGVDDEVRIAFKLSKPAQVEITAENEKGDRATILPPGRREAGDVSVVWDGSAGGRVFGGKRLPDGQYTLTLVARDDAGNVRTRQAPLRIANGGIERLEITDVLIGPTQLKLGDRLRVSIRVANTGETVLRTMGPAPSTLYRTNESFSTIKDPATGQPYPLTSGAWRVGLGWQNAPQELPIRWGLLSDPSGTIPPGGTATVEAVVQVEPGFEFSPTDGKPKPVRFWVGAIREGVGLATGRVGDQVVTILP